VLAWRRVSGGLNLSDGGDGNGYSEEQVEVAKSLHAQEFTPLRFQWLRREREAEVRLSARDGRCEASLHHASLGERNGVCGVAAGGRILE
jgi:hypothetical protein